MKCPFLPLKLRVAINIRTSNENEMFISNNNQTRKETSNECGMLLVKTTEGLYLAPGQYNFEKVASAKIETILYEGN